MFQMGPLRDIRMEEVWKKCIQKNKSLVLSKVACKGLPYTMIFFPLTTTQIKPGTAQHWLLKLIIDAQFMK